MREEQSADPFERIVRGTLPDKTRLYFHIMSHGTWAGFQTFSLGKCDAVAASCPVRRDFVVTLKALGIGDPEAPLFENVVALDGITMISNRKNPVSSLTLQQLKGILTGKITNWRQVGGLNAPIHVANRDQFSGTREAVLLLLGIDERQLDVHEEFDTTQAVVQQVSSDCNALGYVTDTATFNAGVNRVAVGEEPFDVQSATHETIKNEVYPLTRRLYLYAQRGKNPRIDQLIRFILSEPGQDAVSECGYTDLNVDREYTPKLPLNAPDGYRKLVGATKRLPLNFYFRCGQADLDTSLDSRATEDVERLAHWLIVNKQRSGSHRLIIVGFADGTGPKHLNEKLAEERAEVVKRLLEHRFKREQIYGISVIHQGFGSQCPVGDNRTPAGRKANRRAECWIEDTTGQVALH